MAGEDIDWAALIDAGTKVAGAAASGRASGRAAEGTANQAQDREAILRYQAEQQAKINAALLTENATKDRADRFLTDSQKRAQQVGLGDLLANVQDVQMSGMPSYIPHMSFSGGLRPSALGPNTRAAGQNLSRQALEAQLSGADIPNLPDVSGLGTAAPALTPLPQSSKLDTLLNLLSYGGQGYGAYEEATKGRESGPGQMTTRASAPGFDPTTTTTTTDAASGGNAASAGYGGAGRGNLIQALNQIKLAQAQNRGSGG
jgi:hypothetical protein